MSRVVSVRNLLLGGDNPVVIQSMWKDPLREDHLQSVAEELSQMQRWGCGIMRFAVPNKNSAHLLGKLAGMTDMPLVADIHFDHSLALLCMDYPIAKIRINPGNIGSHDKVKEVVRKASDKGVPLRIGVNAGSLPAKLQKMANMAEAMILAAEEEMDVLEKLAFKNYLVSLKASESATTVRANRLFASRYDVPLHIGVTEAGPLIPSLVKSTAALLPLLTERIGATIRVSISDAPKTEILTAREIIRESGQESNGVRLVSCPRCGRATFDTHAFLKEAEDLLASSRSQATVAIMGCLVNGPGEAKHADIALTGTGNSVTLFRNGEPVRKVLRGEALQALADELTTQEKEQI